MIKIAFSQKFIGVFLLVLLIKVVLASYFSSAYQNSLFIPFVSSFLHGHLNPWQWVYEQNLPIEFPYFPAMLFFLCPFYALYNLIVQITGSLPFLQNLLFKFPSFIADIGIFFILLQWFPKRQWRLLWIYFASPILLYAVYMHGQLDLIPMALLLGALYTLTLKKWGVAGGLIGVAVATKLHVIVVLPLILIYLYKNERIKSLLTLILSGTLVFLLISLPFVFSVGFKTLVLANHKQMMVFDSFYKVDSLKLYLPIFFVGLLYILFFTSRKANRDLLLSFIGISLAVFVFLVHASPGWYVWLVPFVSFFLVKFRREAKPFLWVYSAWTGLFLIYFLFFFIPDYQDLIGLNGPIWLKYMDEHLKNLCFTGLEVALMGLIYGIYKIGVKSNLMYQNGMAMIIGIGGDSAVGKSTLNAKIKDILGKLVVEIEGDGDHKWERGDDRWKQFTHLNPKANDLHRQLDHLLCLKSWKPVYRSDYNHKTGKFDLPSKVMPKDYIILSGLHPFYLPNMRHIIDLKIYIDTEEKLRQHWKVLRDRRERGYTTQSVLTQIQNRKDDSHKYIYPQKLFADLIIRFFSDTEFIVGQEDNPLSIKLQLTFDASLHIEGIVQYLLHCDFPCEWEYSQDLKTQYIILDSPVPIDILDAILDQFIPNIEDLIPYPVQWADGYYGIIQVIVILLIAKIQGGTEQRYAI